MVEEGPYPIGLRGPADDQESRAQVTLEPGGQVELSGSPHRSLSALESELLRVQAAMLRLADKRELRWVACGYSPFADVETIPWVPKSR